MLTRAPESTHLETFSLTLFKKHDREKYKAHMQKVCSNELFRLAAESNSTTYQLSASDGP